jgi:hypothetical protein
MRLIAKQPLFQHGFPVYKYGEFDCTEKEAKFLLNLGVAKRKHIEKKEKAKKA